MHRFLVIIILVFFIAFKGSDSAKVSDIITWISPGEFGTSTIMSDFFRFEGAVYSDQPPFLPMYVRQFAIGHDQDMNVEIINTSFIKFGGEEVSHSASGLFPDINLDVNRKKSGNDEYIEIKFVPVVKKGEEIFLLESFEIRSTVVNSLKKSTVAYSWKSSSVLDKGKWVKIRTSKRGIHKIPYEKLTAMGFTSPAQVNVYGNGGIQLAESLDETPVDDLVKTRTWHGRDAGGKDCLYFYSTGNVSWAFDSSSGTFRHRQNIYTRDSYYFLSQEGNAPHAVEKLSPVADPVTKTVQQFDDYVRYEAELINLIRSGNQWFGENFMRGTSRTFSLPCPNSVAGRNAKVRINVAARSSAASSFSVNLNGSGVAAISFTGVNTDDATSLYAVERNSLYNVSVAAGKIDVGLAYQAGNSLSNAWLDYITVNWRRQLLSDSDELYFRDTESTGAGEVVRFQIEGAATGTRVFDVTDPSSVFEIPAVQQGNVLSFVRPAVTVREYVAFRPTGNFPEPETVGEVANQNLHALDVPDFVIVTHPDFREQAEIIADFHRGYDGMSVHVATTAEIYNEFGGGSPDATAIRNFIRMFYDRSKRIKYVMLMGDGSYDNRSILGGKRAMIPTFQSESSLLPTSSFVSDDYFVILDQGESVYNGLVDLGIGRLPVGTRYEAQIVTEKILNYYSPSSLGQWRNVVCFIGDDGDNGLHMADSERLAGQINTAHREFQTEKIYFDAYPVSSTPAGKRYPGVTEAINQRVKDGVLVLNYVGHANDRFLAEERVLDVSVINSWTNSTKLPIFVTATCEFSRFDADDTSAGEYILLNPKGGGIGLFSTTRVVYAYSNYLLSRNFYQVVFEKDSNGENYRMGDIMRLAKIQTVNTLNKRNFTLLANPALRLSYPRYRVETKTLNNRGISEQTDTLSALSRVNITGEITDHLGNTLRDFNGTVTAVVYDKAQRVNTLGNSGQTPFSYTVQNNIVYKGLATVVNGDFSFNFVIPKDISYSIGQGKILYYADNGTIDANGAFEGFSIGGGSSSQISDNKGPEVQLYMDHTSFRSGDQTSRNPLLIAHLSDENGINTVGSGIGHDITAVLNNDYSNVYVLNEFYKSDKDDFTRGKIEYQFKDLRPGENSLVLKVWDVANNSTEAEITFMVTGDFYIESVTNYPNPVTDYTNFTFTHNQPDAVFNTLFEVFDLAGRRIDMMNITTTSTGMNSIPFRWDPDERGLRLRNGLYTYRITIRSGEGQLAGKSGKMMIGR
jgi:hypothetical protein